MENKGSKKQDTQRLMLLVAAMSVFVAVIFSIAPPL